MIYLCGVNLSMRELTFELDYVDRVGPLVDIFTDCSELTSASIASCVDRDCCWVVERFVGPASVLDQIERIRSDADVPAVATTEAECDAIRHPTVLERSPTTLIIYVFIESLHTCDSIYALAARRLEPGVVIQSRRQGRSQTFRLLVRSGENIDRFYDRFQEVLRDGISAQFGHLEEANRWAYDSLAGVSLSEEQRLTLQTAAENGYYEIPRQITLDELAKKMDLPRSTVSYRLRRAEADLTKGYLGQVATPMVK